MISVVDYGIGNVGSVMNMLRHIGAMPVRATTIEDINIARALILPGVGAFGVAMDTLHAKGFVEPLRRRALQDRIPLLGICLGMQLMSHRSEEGGDSGLGLIDAHFVKFSIPTGSLLKVPHMGWNTITIARENCLLKENVEEQRFYFVHSYHAVCNCQEDVIATSHHGGNFVAVYGRDNILGVQFHPEKSHKFGMTLFRNFVKIAC